MIKQNNIAKKVCLRIVVSVLFLLCGIGCDSGYKKKFDLAKTQAREQLQNKPYPFQKWQAKELGKALQRYSKDDIKRGVIYLAYFGGSLETNGQKHYKLKILYLSANNPAKQLRFIKDGYAVLTLPQSEVTKLTLENEGENSRLHFVDEYIWEEKKDPFMSLGREDIYVELVMKDGTSVGRTKVLQYHEARDRVKLFENGSE